MAHDLLQDRMAYVGPTPWHELGQEVPPNVSAPEMCRAAGLDWKVHKLPAPGARLLDPRKQRYDRYIIFRDRLRGEPEEVALGMVGHGYEPLQNSEAFKFFEPFIDNQFAHFETAGAVENGGRVWVMVRLRDQIVVGKDDVIDRYVLLSNSHDGTGSVTIRFTPVRVVCKNTLNLSLKGGRGVVSVRHTRNIARTLMLEQTAQLEAVIEKVFSDANTLFGKMVLKTMNAKDTDRFLEALFPRTETQKKKGEQPERWIRIKSILDDPVVIPTAFDHFQ